MSSVLTPGILPYFNYVAHRVQHLFISTVCRFSCENTVVAYKIRRDSMPYLWAFVEVAIVLEHARREEEVVDHAGKVESAFSLNKV